MPKLIDLTGKKYNHLSVISLQERRKNATMWLCLCDCGKNTVVDSRNLKTGHTKSCGCWNLQAKKNRKIHGESHGSQEWYTWVSMKARCLTPNNKYYSYYGGRGIKICHRWLESYQNFLQDMGRAPSNNHSIDRIDVNGDYEPLNCRWATAKQQANNKRKTKRIEFNGQLKTISEWCDELGLDYGLTRQRINRDKMPLEKVFLSLT